MRRQAAIPKKYEHIDFTPPEGVANAAAKGLELRQKASPSNRGGLTSEEAGKQGIGSGVQRAVNLKNRDTISPEVIKQMRGFLSRSEKSSEISAENKSTPWNDKGYVAWLLWGGDPAKAWTDKIIKQMEAADEKEKQSKQAALMERWGSMLVTADENEPTNPGLWEKVQALAKGEQASMTHDGKTINGPNDGKGFTVFPCVPVDGSEALTRQGWRSYGELRVGDEIVTYNKDSDCLEWGEIRHLHHHKEAPVIRLHKAATCFDFVCTADHKWVIKQSPRTGSVYKPRARKYPDQLVPADQITQNMKVITSAVMTDGDPVPLCGFRKHDWSWVERVLAMSHEQREAWFASAIVYDGHEIGYSERYDRCSYGFSQKDPDHAEATAICAVLLGYNVSFRKKKHNPSMMSYTFIDRRTHSTGNVVKEDVGVADVWCPQTDNQTWVMRQGQMVTITGNSAYANGWASKVYGDLGGGWKKKAGWWGAPYGQMGDGPADIMGPAVDRVRAAYRESWQREPTMAELYGALDFVTGPDRAEGVIKSAARYKCVPEGMRLIDYTRGYKQISKIQRIPIAKENGEVVVGLEDITDRDLLIRGKPYMGTKEMEALFSDEVVIEEKVDGHPMIALYEGYTFFCESLKVRHSVDYDACPYSLDGWPDMLVVYEVMDGEHEPPYSPGFGTGKWLTRSEKVAVCRMVGAPVVPARFKGRISPEDVPNLAAAKSGFGSGQAEGVVIKNLKKGIFGKFVNIEFQKKITDEDTWGGVHPERLGIKNIRRIADAWGPTLREARGKAKKDVGHGGLDEWFSGHGGAKGKGEDATWGDWVSISPVTKTLPSGKKVEKGDIVGECGISDDPDWKEITKGGEDPLKCMPRQKAHDMPKSERAEKAKAKQRAEDADSSRGKKPTMTPTFDKKKARLQRIQMKREAAARLRAAWGECD